jgi:plasmid stability protein
MPTLYVENVPQELYEGLREQAKRDQRSIAAEVISLLKLHIPTKDVTRRRRKAIEGLARLRNMKPLTEGPFPSAEELIREDRER